MSDVTNEKIDESSQLHEIEMNAKSKAKIKVLQFVIVCMLGFGILSAMLGAVGFSLLETSIANGTFLLGVALVIGCVSVLIYIGSVTSNSLPAQDVQSSVFVGEPTVTFVREKNGRLGKAVAYSNVALDGLSALSPLSKNPASSANGVVGEESGSEPNFGVDSPQASLSNSMHLNMPFELYANAVVKTFDERINFSENKASQLLNRGQWLMGFGVVFYIGAIVFWQIAVRAWGYSHPLIAAMISCSLVFIVIEFLAAWFLRQYRSYIEASMAYLQVRSVYTNYLLTYYAVNQFGQDAENRSTLVDMLGGEIKWPAFKELSKNDFNYMAESISGFSMVLEKLKSLAPAKSKAPSRGKGKDSASSI